MQVQLKCQIVPIALGSHTNLLSPYLHKIKKKGLPQSLSSDAMHCANSCKL